MKRLLIGLGTVIVATASAADWPEWRGAGRDGVWREDGIVEKFPASGLTRRWSVPVAGGYSGPAVARGRVFLTDYRAGEARAGTERVLCVDEKSGRMLWEKSWPVSYLTLQANYAIGPRATPTVDDDRVYVVGAMGNLLCVEAASGKVLWERDYVKEYQTVVPVWGRGMCDRRTWPRGQLVRWRISARSNIRSMSVSACRISRYTTPRKLSGM